VVRSLVSALLGLILVVSRLTRLVLLVVVLALGLVVLPVLQPVLRARSLLDACLVVPEK
jgi:ABC-type phosphate transport system permease subunit